MTNSTLPEGRETSVFCICLETGFVSGVPIWRTSFWLTQIRQEDLNSTGGVVAEGVLGQPDLSIPRFDSNNSGDEIKDISNSLEGYWSYTWTDLAKFEDGKELDYSIKETEIPDGYTEKVEINKDGHFILTNTHQVKSIEPTEASEPEEPRKPKKASQPDKLKYVSKNPQTSDTGQLLG